MNTVTNLTHMIRKSIAINSSDKSSDNVSFIQNGSNQQLLCDYVELLDSQLNEIQTQKMVKDTVDELLEDFKNHQTYTHHVFEHSFVIAQQSSLLTDILIEYLSYKDVLYQNLRHVLKSYYDKYQYPLAIDHRVLSMANITDFEKMVREHIPFIFKADIHSDISEERMMYIYQHLGVLHTTRLLNDTMLNQLIPKLNEVDIHELKHYFTTASFDYIKRFNYHFSKRRIQIYYENHIADIQSLILWGYDDNEALNYLYSYANDMEQEDIIGALLNLEPLQTIPDTMYELKNGVQTILRVYLVYLLKGDYQTTQNVIRMLTEYLNQITLQPDKSRYKQYVKSKDVLMLEATIMQYENLSTMNTGIIDRLKQSDIVVLT